MEAAPPADVLAVDGPVIAPSELTRSEISTTALESTASNSQASIPTGSETPRSATVAPATTESVVGWSPDLLEVDVKLPASPWGVILMASFGSAAWVAIVRYLWG